MSGSLYVVDNFYKDPDKVRAFALSSSFLSAGRYNYPGWQSARALSGDALAAAFGRIIHEHVQPDPDRYTWGGFRVITEETGAMTKVHADTAVRWAAMVYLTPGIADDAGTGFFRHRETGLFGPPTDAQAREMGYADANEFEERVARRDMADLDRWELVSHVAPEYNRLVIFRGSRQYHAPLSGAGSRAGDARLTQNFFFNTRVDAGADATGVRPWLEAPAPAPTGLG
ncbi:DUF6445 family protein [Gandjariella thermophila]|uniref:Uncharacterized protein n=1 Tax=Gandjariella thermophila TaxID=1931992 RepID=A0A4D4JB18_9PSEU|nr:DUF6445 family protein [Gandjariella thermophila]GDY33851.1 hypothetical protein GTS_54840 [Gandjariella thermophila]